MTTTGGPPAGGLPLTDITGRMAVFGKLFCDHVGLEDPSQIADTRQLVELVNQRVPRTTEPAEDAPIFEAAAFVGEWLRAWGDAAWIAEGPFEPHLQLAAPRSSVVYLLPIVSVVRVASTAGYDGLPKLLDSILEDMRDPPARSSLDEIRITPASDRARLAAWVRAKRDIRGASLASLWRRCQTCSRITEDSLLMRMMTDDWEHDASAAAGALARRPFACECGGVPGDVSRFVMLRAEEDELRLADIYLSGTHTRVACWRIEGDEAEPLDATALSAQNVVG